MSKRIAFVVQRYGLEVNGGSELLCRMIAERVASRCSTEVLTTCALDHMTWANHYPPGEERLGEALVQRFPVVKPRDLRSFDRLSESIRPRIGKLTIAEEEKWMRELGPVAPGLLEYLSGHKHDYDAFIFFTYLYATTYFGLPLVADTSILLPTAHDEWYIYLSLYDRLMEMPRAFVFNTPEERAFMQRRFAKHRLNGPVIGASVEPPATISPETFRKKHGIENPFLLYVGRVDAAKGVGQLLEDFQAYRRASGDQRTDLLLLGRPVMEIPKLPGIRALGFLSEQDKWDALAGCEAIIMPSAHESLSIACLEAWSVGKPALVNAQSDVLVGQCRRSQGGLWYANTSEFCAALDSLLREPALSTQLGMQGKKFVESNYRWPQIIDAYCEVASNLGLPCSGGTSVEK